MQSAANALSDFESILDSIFRGIFPSKAISIDVTKKLEGQGRLNWDTLLTILVETFEPYNTLLGEWTLSDENVGTGKETDPPEVSQKLVLDIIIYRKPMDLSALCTIA